MRQVLKRSSAGTLVPALEDHAEDCAGYAQSSAFRRLEVYIPQDRKSKAFYALDCPVTGETVYIVAPVNLSALKILRAENPELVVRYVRVDETDYREEDAQRRKRLWASIKYR